MSDLSSVTRAPPNQGPITMEEKIPEDVKRAAQLGFASAHRSYDGAPLFVRMSAIEVVIDGDDFGPTVVCTTSGSFQVKGSAADILDQIATSIRSGV